MSDKDDEKPSSTSNNLNDSNDDGGEIISLVELLDQQREIDEVKFCIPAHEKS